MNAVRGLIKRCLCLCAVLLGIASFSVNAAEVLRVGALKYGTVNWELDVIKRHNLDYKHGFELAVVDLGSPQATVIALQGGRVDLVVNDWVWVNKQKNSRREYGYSPYSTAIGGLVVSPAANIHSLADLRGKRIGVAGGPVDKGWLLFRAYSKKVLGVDLNEISDIKFAAPPLLNHLLLAGELDAVINYWHYNARLIAAGMKTLLSTEELLGVFGIEHKVPMLGWVFERSSAERRPELMNAFFAASFEAKAILAESDTEWEAIRPLLKADSYAVFSALKAAYRAGIPEPLSPADAVAIRTIYGILYPSTASTLVEEAGAATMMSLKNTEPNRKDKNNNFDEGMFWWQLLQRQES
ncbi:ABC transporter substrate-binding protein [Zhongshania borealis]|uniref:ABC transporter substrate-binding protein n=1 Tax=Zhongshania borealis TaxID=889488 RepID=A0ABP7WS34_9GAMM